MVTAKSPEHPLAPPAEPRSPRRQVAVHRGRPVDAPASGAVLQVRTAAGRPGPAATARRAFRRRAMSTCSPRRKRRGTRRVQEGVQQWRDGSRAKQASSRERHREGPGFAAAYLELAFELLSTRGARSAQEHYQKAFSHRDHLLPRDRSLLDAMDPLVRASGESERGGGQAHERSGEVQARAHLRTRARVRPRDAGGLRAGA